MRRETRRGTTLPETLLVLTLLGVLAGLALPPLGRLDDHAAVLAARETLIGRVVEARSLAAEAGGATLVVRSDPGSTFLVVGADTVRRAPLGVDGVRVDRAADLDFDAMGLGRFANATLRLTRGSASASVVVSAYGRPGRR